MKKKILLFTGIFTGSIFALIIAFYFIVAVNYKGGFTYGTWVNGVYCANKSIDEVNRELINRYDYKNIEVSSDYFETEIIDIKNIDFSVDYKESLKKLKDSQNPYNWYKNLSKSYINSFIYPVVSYDENKLINEVNNLQVFDYYNPNNLYKVEIAKNNDGYYLVDERRLCLKSDDLIDQFKEAALLDSNVFIDSSYFTKYKDTSYIKSVLKLWDEVSDYIKPRFTIDLGAEVINIDSALLSDLLVKDNNSFYRDENNNLVYSDEMIDSFVEELLTPYNTFGKPRDYVTYKGEKKHIELILYGTTIDIPYEKEYVKKAIKEKITETHIPKYIKEGYVRGLNDIGPEYIEVDITNQKLLYIKDNQLIMETDVVTGNPRVGSGTPEAVCYIYKKATKCVLVGENYRSPVDYWMAINGAIGLHDASWQRAYGGDRYLTHGSHGCVNMQYDDVARLYDMVEVGIPVIVYK